MRQNAALCGNGLNKKLEKNILHSDDDADLNNDENDADHGAITTFSIISENRRGKNDGNTYPLIVWFQFCSLINKEG